MDNRLVILEKLKYYKQHFQIDTFETICLSAIAFTLPTKLVQTNNICILVLCGLFIVKIATSSFEWKDLQNNLVSNYVLYLILIFFSYVLSLFYSENFSMGISSIETRFSLIALPIVLSNLKGIGSDRNKINLILISFLTACLVTSVVCLSHTIYINYINGRSYVSYYSWYYSADSLVENYGFHASYFSIYCAFCIFILAYFVKNRKINFKLAIVLTVYLIFFQLLLASRIGIIALVITATLTIVYEMYLLRKFLYGVVLSVIFLIIVGLSVLNFSIVREKFFALASYNINEYNEAFKIDSRLQIWKASINILRKNPIFGVGIGDTKDELKKQFAELDFKTGYENSYDSHNLFLETIVSCGVFGAIPLILLLLFSFSLAIQRKNLLYLQFLLLFMLLSSSEATFAVQKGVVFFSYMNSLFFLNTFKRTNSFEV